MIINTVKQEGTQVELALVGRLDTTSAAAAQESFAQVASKVSRVVLNFQDLDYISSAGLRTLLILQKKMTQKGGSLELYNVNELVQEVLDMTGFGDLLTIR